MWHWWSLSRYLSPHVTLVKHVLASLILSSHMTGEASLSPHVSLVQHIVAPPWDWWSISWPRMQHWQHWWSISEPYMQHQWHWCSISGTTMWHRWRILCLPCDTGDTGEAYLGPHVTLVKHIFASRVTLVINGEALIGPHVTLVKHILATYVTHLTLVKHILVPMWHWWWWGIS